MEGAAGYRIFDEGPGDELIPDEHGVCEYQLRGEQWVVSDLPVSGCLEPGSGLGRYNFWMNQLAVGQTRVYVVEQFVGEPEFQSVQASRLGYHTAYVTVTGVTPSSSSGASGVAQQFTVHYTNPYGPSDISLGQVVFNADSNGVNASGACQMQWDTGKNLILMTPTSSQYGVIQQSGVLSNAYCSVDTGSATLTPTGTGYDVSVWVTFASQFSQAPGSTNHAIYAFGRMRRGCMEVG